MKTINIETARNKTKPVMELLDGLEHVRSVAPGLASYHAAKAVTHANLRTGVERRCAAVKSALKGFNVVVSIAHNDRALPTVRIYSAIKQTELFL